jgi:pyruvate/2-oxoglutarate dehydrogenase complex dihydrolipoamide dehydrogenase (E3) component
LPSQGSGGFTASDPEEDDVVVLGSGEAGKYLAWAFAAEGKRVAVVERRYVGGSCPNIACLPSKNVIHTAKVASYFRRGVEFGQPATDGPVDMAAVRHRKRKMVDGLVEVHLHKYRTSGTEPVMGSGTFATPKTIQVALHGDGTRTLRGEVVILSTGSRPRIDDTLGLKEARPLSHVEALELDRVPEHLAVLGGGYVGLEQAQAFRRLGGRVTVVVRNGALIHREDPDVTAAVGQLFRDEGIEVVTRQAVDGTLRTYCRVNHLRITDCPRPAPEHGRPRSKAPGIPSARPRAVSPTRPARAAPRGRGRPSSASSAVLRARG